MVEPYLDQINGRLTDDVNIFSGGLNTYMDKAFINPDQLPYSFNMSMYKPPMITTRPSRENVFVNEFNDKHVSSIWAYDENLIIYTLAENDYPNTELLCSRRRNVITGYWDEVYYSGVSSVITPRKNIYYTYCRTAVDEYAYVGNENYKIRMKSTPNGLHEPFEATKIEDGHYGIPCWHKGRLFLADPYTNIITFSALYDYDNFTPIPDEPDPDIDYSSYAGDFFVTNAKGKIKMIVSFDDKLVIFCEHSIHLLYGDTPLTSSSYQFQLVDFALNLGCQAPKSVAISGSYLFWLGDDKEIYSYSGSSLDMISRPNASRYVNRYGGISNLEIPDNSFLITDNDIDAMGTASSSKYYIQFPVRVKGTEVESVRFPLFVYDIYNKIWWAEDGDLDAIANFSSKKDHIVMYKRDYSAVLKTTDKYTGVDYLYNSETGENDLEEPIFYEFHTRVYGADGANSRKTISKIWVQASASCDVFLTDSWLSSDPWSGPFPDMSLKKIGELGTKGRKEMTSNYLDTYDPLDYEQQYCIVPKMYGERLNTFQVVVRGSGASKFYLMKREWSAR